ncbi:MAG: hypothetical protein J7574_14440 [Flavobacterium sp.]|uniref:hypothetical protein n=1 Tax=Flavobacterium sp. TaxID=239 RepID=UPI001B01AF6A|nr:hypothetical protein [Flavobacterium sp.]MBO9585358.1 hypothetical protein [Flavobacterium sp.]
MVKCAKIFEGLFLVGYLLLMAGCATEEIVQKNATGSPLETKVWFDNHQKDYSATVLNYIEDLQWQNAIVSTGEIGEVVEVPFTLTESLSASTKEANQYNDHHRLMFVKDEQNGYKLFYVQIFANDEDYNVQDKNYNYYNIKDNFDGNIYVQELATNIGSKIKFKDGEKIEHSNTGKMQEYACVYYGWWGSDGSFTPIYEVGCYGGGGGNGVPSGGGENPGPGYGGGTSSSNTPSCPAGYRYKLGECVFVDKITNLLTGKAKCLNDLLTQNGNDFVKNLFSKFEGTSKFDISISSKDVVMGTKNGVESEINGKTLKPKGKLIEIEISTSRVNARAPIEVARIILHEYIHADIYRKLGTVLATNVENLDFKETFEKYEGEHHSVMAKLYVDSIKESLKQFHQLFPGDIKAYTDYYNEAPSDAFYEALAWGGLRDSNVKAWNELSAEKKASIEALASRVEQFSKTNPCNN